MPPRPISARSSNRSVKADSAARFNPGQAVAPSDSVPASICAPPQVISPPPDVEAHPHPPLQGFGTARAKNAAGVGCSVLFGRPCLPPRRSWLAFHLHFGQRLLQFLDSRLGHLR